MDNKNKEGDKKYRDIGQVGTRHSVQSSAIACTQTTKSI